MLTPIAIGVSMTLFVELLIFSFFAKIVKEPCLKCLVRGKMSVGNSKIYTSRVP